MWRVVKWVFVLLLIAGALAAMSYAGARATAGKVLGSNPPMSERTIVFNFKGVADLPGRPRAWVVTYGRTRLPGVRQAMIYVSATGNLIATQPADLDQRLEAWEKSQQP